MVRVIGLLPAALVAVGLIVSVNVQDPPPMPSSQEAGYFVLAGDFHVHSFPGDGALPPWEIAREAARRRLDVVALTNHNSMLSSRLAEWLGLHGRGALLIPSQELTSVGYHLAAVGVDGIVDWRQSIPQAVAAIHARGGVAIGAHPGGRLRERTFDAPALAALDGIEAAHPGMLGSSRMRNEIAGTHARALEQNPAIATIGSSDFHHVAPIGVCRTYLFAKSRAREGVLEAIRAGRTVACDGHGQTYGPPDLALLVADDCRAAATAPPAGSSSIDTISTWSVWFGLLGMVLVGSRQP